MKTLLPFTKYAAVAVIAATSAFPALAQLNPENSGTEESALMDPVPDAFQPPGQFSDDPMMGIKAGESARWAFIGYLNDQTKFTATFLSGTTATGNFPNCTTTTVPQWIVTVTREGASLPVANFGSNVWTNVEATSARCGVAFTIAPRGYQVLTPGNYTFRVQQPGTGMNVSQSITVRPCTAPIPMYSSRHEAYTDNFYTTLLSDHNTAVNSIGYVNTGIAFRVSATNELTAPFKRFFKGAPQIEHFYTHLASEEQSITPQGWGFERNEGNIFPALIAGTLPLTRLARYDGATGGLEHFYTTDAGQVSTHQAAGWVSDGVKGYVCAP